MAPVRILLVDDQLLFRKGLRALLEDEDGFEVGGGASGGAQWGGGGAGGAPRLIKSEWPDIKVVALTISDEDEDLFEAIKSGADGYLLKDLRPEERFGLLHGVLRGETPISPAVAGKLLTEFRQRPWHDPGESAAWDLTSRELEILQLVAGGFRNAEIAARLFIVEGTVKNHVHNILEKLHLENRVQAAAHAIRQGLVNLPKDPEA